jgi:eukaryotic-like serine/threonine-protein kinase
MAERSLPEETIFAQALEIESAAEREAYLDRACGDDGTLRAEIEALLRCDARAGDLLDLPEGPTATGDRPGTESAGAVIGPYKLVRAIGEGGMGAVWLAEQGQPVRRKVALKIIKSGMDSRQVTARFAAERQALAMMDHPNIAKVLDGGTTEGGRPYFAMELVEGSPITRYCDDHNMTPRERLELFLPVCHAVQHAHQKGIIHRDLKPSNVLVALYDGVPVPKIIDFGVAKAVGHKLTDGTTFTQHGQVVGTLEYMSPEQASFNSLDIDTRSDIYSLGVLLYELLTGTTPFEKARLRAAAFDEILRIIREEEAPRPSARLSELRRTSLARQTDASPTMDRPQGTAEPERIATSISARRKTAPTHLGRMLKGDLDWIVMKALEKDRNRRYATANELAMDLQRYLADEPVVACPPSVRYQVGKFVRRNKGMVLAASLVVLALVSGILGTTWGMIRATDQLFLALLNQARAGRFSRQVGQRLDSLAALDRAARIRPDERLRDEAIAAMALPDLRLATGWHASPPGSTIVAYGGQYTLYARADTRGAISIRTIPDDREIRRIDSDSPLSNLSFSPDDRFLLGLGKGAVLRVWHVSDGQPVLREQPRGCRGYAFSPDGHRLAVGQQGWVLCFDLLTGLELNRWRLPEGASSLAFHPDSRKLAVGYVRATIASVYDATNGVLLTDLPVGGNEVDQLVTWHPDGERLAVAGVTVAIQIWNVAAKRLVATLEGHSRAVDLMTFHPDGELMASRGWDGTLRLWHPASGRQLMQLTALGTPQFSTDGRWLGVALHGERADLLEVTPNREYRTLVSSAGVGKGGYGLGDISPDGRLLVVGMDDGARLWDLRSGRELARLPPWTTYVFFDREPGEGTDSVAPGSLRWSLLTSGSDGLQRWPTASDDPEGRRLRLESPQPLSSLRRAWFSRGTDGRTLGVATEEGGRNQILDFKTGVVQRELGIHPRGEVRALSGDGRWAASSGWVSDRVRLWNAGTGQMVHEWVLGKRTFVYFSPDSRALIIARDHEFSFWDVETFRPIRRLARDVAQLPGWVAFSPDGRLMALEMAPAVIHLKEVATGRTVAKLEDPHGDRASWQGFTPDGTQLVVVATHASVIHIWDLRAIRARLKEMGLDWDWPEFPLTVTGSNIAAPATIVVPRNPPRIALTLEEDARRDIESRHRYYQANPDSALRCNNLAWSYLVAPEAQRDVKAALPLAEKAFRLAPEIGAVRNTLALAYYRNERYREAVEILRANLRDRTDFSLASDLYLLAMNFHRLGETTRARDYYEWAVHMEDAAARSLATRPRNDLDGSVNINDVKRYRAEATALLGIDREKD